MNYKGKEAATMTSKVGYNLVGGFQTPIGSGFYFGMDLGSGTRGYNEAGLVEYGKDIYLATESMICFNVQLSPITLGFKCEMVKKLKLDLHAGGYASYDFAGNIHMDTPLMRGDLSLGALEKVTGIGWNRFDVGVNLGAGLWYDRFNIDVTYQCGFVKALDTRLSTNDITVNNLLVRVGVAF